MGHATATGRSASGSGERLASLQLRGVTKLFGATLAVDDVHLVVPPGRVTALIGPSGCGKSTILRLLNGLVRPDRGEVVIHGAVIDGKSLAAVRRRMGYVIQDGGLFPHLTAGENVVVMARHLGWDAARISARLDRLSALVRLDSALLGRYPRELSGGQAQRVALMRALMLDPSVLLLDEPLAALDPMIRSALQDDLREIFAALRATVVLVSHDLAEATHLAHHIVLMRAGQIVQQGPPGELLTSPISTFAEQFVRAQRVLNLGTAE